MWAASPTATSRHMRLTVRVWPLNLSVAGCERKNEKILEEGGEAGVRGPSALVYIPGKARRGAKSVCERADKSIYSGGPGVDHHGFVFCHQSLFIFFHFLFLVFPFSLFSFFLKHSLIFFYVSFVFACICVTLPPVCLCVYIHVCICLCADCWSFFFEFDFFGGCVACICVFLVFGVFFVFVWFIMFVFVSS